MPTKSIRPCHSLKPSACPYHGALIRMDQASAAGDSEGYLKAKEDLREAELDKIQSFRLNFFSPRLPLVPPGASYKYTGKTLVNEDGVLLYQIKTTSGGAGKRAPKGIVGGWVDPTPLADGTARISGEAWLAKDAQLYGNARISGYARISGKAKIFGNAEVSGNARIYDNAEVSGNAKIFGDAKVSGDTQISGDANLSGGIQFFGAESAADTAY